MPARSTGLLPPPVPAPKIAAPCHNDAKQDHALASPRFPESARQQQCAQRPVGGRPLHRHDEMPFFGDCAFCGWRALQPLRRTHPRRGRGTRALVARSCIPGAFHRINLWEADSHPFFTYLAHQTGERCLLSGEIKPIAKTLQSMAERLGDKGQNPAFFFRNMKTRATQFHVGKEM